VAVCKFCGNTELTSKMIRHEAYDSEVGEEFLVENLIEDETEYSCRPCGESYMKECQDRLKKELQNQKTGIS
jgi:hypothetical protein